MNASLTRMKALEVMPTDRFMNYREVSEMMGVENLMGMKVIASRLSILSDEGILEKSHSILPNGRPAVTYRLSSNALDIINQVKMDENTHMVTNQSLPKRLLQMMGYNTCPKKAQGKKHIREMDSFKYMGSGQTFRPSFGVSTAFLMMREGE